MSAAPIGVINEFGASSNKDGNTPIAWSVQTGWMDLGASPGQDTNIHRVFLEIEATPGVNMKGIVLKACAAGHAAAPAAAPQPGVPSRVPPPGGYTSVTSQRPLTYSRKH